MFLEDLSSTRTAGSADPPPAPAEILSWTTLTPPARTSSFVWWAPAPAAWGSTYSSSTPVSSTTPAGISSGWSELLLLLPPWVEPALLHPWAEPPPSAPFLTLPRRRFFPSHAICWQDRGRWPQGVGMWGRWSRVEGGRRGGGTFLQNV